MNRQVGSLIAYERASSCIGPNEPISFYTEKHRKKTQERIMIASRTIAKKLLKLALDPRVDEKELADRFFDFAKKNDLLRQMRTILYYLEAEIEKGRREEKVRVTTAHPISSDTLGLIKRYIGAPREALATVEVDPALIGGFMGQYHGRIYDASMRARLAGLQKMLMSEK